MFKAGPWGVVPMPRVWIIYLKRKPCAAGNEGVRTGSTAAQCGVADWNIL
jgi:hypothetical protein